MVLARSLIALSAATSALAAKSGSPRDALLVTPGWLSTHLNDGNLVILHVGVRANYPAKHIPGARYIDMMDVSVSDFSEMGPMPAGMPTPPITGPKNGLSLEMPTAEQLRSQLAKFGISDDSRIVVYKADDYASPSTRIAFTLDYAGLGKNTVMLDGGLPAWIANGGEVTDVVPPAAQPGKLSPLTLRPIVVDAPFVRDLAAKPGVVLIDERAPMFWAGTPPANGSGGRG